MKRIQYNLIGIILIVIGVFSLTGCDLEYPHESNRITEDVSIGEYLEIHADTFSVFAKLLNETGNMAFLKAYGEYTCFVPTNSAFRQFFVNQGLAKETATNQELEALIPNMDKTYLSNLVRFYVIKGDTIASQYFVDGRMGTPTLYGQYLTYGTYFEDGKVVGKINKKAVIEQEDIMVLNGIIHSLANVLEPEKKTIAQYLEQLEGYSIFNEALKATKLYDVLNQPVGTNNDTIWHTFLAVSDQVLNADGIYSVDDIGEKYKKDAIPADSALYLYMAYHILPLQYRFVTDMVDAKAVITLAPSEVLTVKSKGNSVLINDDIFAGIYEPGFEINRLESDQTVDNGVIHFMNGNFFVKIRYPFAVYWDVTEQIEIMKMPGVFRKINADGLVNGQLANVSWLPENTTIDYKVGAINSAYGHVYNDYFSIYLRPAVVQSITFKTPTLVKGTYRVWICMRTQYADVATKNSKFYVYFNGEQTTKILDNRQNYNWGSGYSDGELNLLGIKIYNYDPTAYNATDSSQVATVVANGIANNWVAQAGRYCSEDAGTVIVNETGPQSLQLVAISGGVNAQVWLDQIHFIPVEEDQNWPRVNWRNGTLVYKEDLEAGILP